MRCINLSPTYYAIPIQSCTIRLLKLCAFSILFFLLAVPSFAVDTDNDGISDATELLIGSDPYVGETSTLSLHTEDNNPILEGWTGNLSAGMTTSGIQNDLGFDSWGIGTIFVGSSGGYTQTLNSTQQYGWALIARIRASEFTSPPGNNPLVFTQYSTGSSRYSLTFSGNNFTDTTVYTNDGRSHTLTGEGSVYHLYQIIFNPFTQSAQVYINDSLIFDDYAGNEVASTQEIFFGSATTTAVGGGRYNLVQFVTINGDADRDGDGLTEHEELTLNTNPLSMDTDGDGFNDRVEVNFGTDPLSELNNPVLTKVVPNDVDDDDRFGGSVALSADTAIVSALQNSNGLGAAYVYTRSGNNWIEQQKLVPSGNFVGFGSSVDIDGDTVIVGAGANEEAYVFTRTGSTWSEQQTLTSSDMFFGDNFGFSVGISGDTAVVGAYLDNENGIQSGSAYVFTRNGSLWSEQQKLTASDAASGDLFGNCIDVSGDTVVVCAINDDDNGVNSGSIYAFTRNGLVWNEQQKLTASDAAILDSFGSDVAIENDTIVVGANSTDENEFNSGAAYVFTRSGVNWSEQQKLTASDADANDKFGNSVSISGNKIIIGSAFDDLSTSNSGSAYLFIRTSNSWEEVTKLVAIDADSEDLFGWDVALSNDIVINGAFSDEANGMNSGSAYLFDMDIDDDNLINEIEIQLGTDQFLSDSDEDGLNDFNELNIDGDPTNYTVGIDTDPNNSDTDNDGFSDSEEVNSGSDPNDPLSIPSIPSVKVPSPSWLFHVLVLTLLIIAFRQISAQ